MMCIIFSQQDIDTFNQQFPEGTVGENCTIIPRGPMWDKVTHNLLDKFIVGAQALTDGNCSAAYEFLNTLPQEDVTIDDFPPPPEE